MAAFVAYVIYPTTRHGDSEGALLHPDAIGVVAAVLLLVAFGEFIGRHVRVGSWDVLRPWRLARRLAVGLRPHRGSAAAFTLLYASFLGLMYLVVCGPAIQGLILLDR